MAARLGVFESSGLGVRKTGSEVRVPSPMTAPSLNKTAPTRGCGALAEAGQDEPWTCPKQQSFDRAGRGPVEKGMKP